MNTEFQQSAIDAGSFDAILSKDLQGRITSWNQGAQALYGYAAEEAVGQHISFIVPSHKLAELDDVMRRTQQGQRVEPFETRRRRKDGELIDVSLSISPILSGMGEIIGVSSIARNITRQKRAERALAISERKYQDLYDNAPDMYASLDASNAHIVGCNETLTRALGWPREELIGRPVWDLYHPDCLEAARQAFREFQDMGEVRDRELKLVRVDGAALDVSLSVTAVRDSKGKIVQSRSVWRDITDRVRAKDEIRRQVRQREQFFAVLSHELRNPLGALLSAVEVLQAGGEQAHGGSDAVEVIRRQAQQMASLLDDLLDVARISRNKLVYRKTVVSLESVARDAVQGVRHAVGQKRQRLTVAVNDSPLCVWGDEARLQQVQANLLANATKYTPVGGSIDLTLCRDGDQAVITVRDSGQGITPALLGQVFDLFVQSDESLDRSQGGMGLGLAITRSIVRAHEGTITVYSAGAGRGSEFIVRLPLTDKRPSQRNRSIPQPSFAGCRLLLAEDNDDARRMLAQILRQRGFDVCEAADGREAIAMFAAHSPDAAVIDIGLPQLDGLEVAREIRRGEHGKNALLLALTGYGRQCDQQASAAAGFDKHLVKPLDPSRLVALLAEKLGQPADA